MPDPKPNSGIPEGFRLVPLPPSFYEVKGPEESSPQPNKDVPRGEGDKVIGPTTPESIIGSFNPGPVNRDLGPYEKAGQKLGDVVAPIALTAPMIAAGGEALPAAPAVGRAITSGVVGGAKALGSGQGLADSIWTAVVDSLLSGATEAVTAGAGALKIPRVGWTESLGDKATKVARSAAGREAGGKEIEEAGRLAARRLATANPEVTIPTVSPKPMTLTDAVKKMKGLDDPDFTIVKRELTESLNRLDKSMLGPASPKTPPYAGQIFNKFAPKERFTYSGTPVERALGQANKAVPLARGASDAAMTTEVAPGLPLGGAVLANLLDGVGFSELARHIRMGR